MEVRPGHNDDSDGDEFLPQHRRLGLGLLFQAGELGGGVPHVASSPATSSSLNYNHSGILASGSAFRRPPLFPSPLSSFSAHQAPSVVSIMPAPSYRQPPQLPNQQHAAVEEKVTVVVQAESSADNSHSDPASSLRLPSSLDPKLTLLADRSHHPPPQQKQDETALKDCPDASAAPMSSPTTATGGGSSSTPKTGAPEAYASSGTRTGTPSVAAPASSGPSGRYRECLRNHAAKVGGHILDGCGEFMPGGEDGTAEALNCAACTCHRSFHRKEVESGVEAEGMFVPVSSASSPSGHGHPRRYYLPSGSGRNGGGGYSSESAAVRGGGPRNSSVPRSLYNPPPLSQLIQTPAEISRSGHARPPVISMLPPSSGMGAFAPSPSSGVMAALGKGNWGGNDDEENTNYSGGTTTTESSSEEMQQTHKLAGMGSSALQLHGTPTPSHGIQAQISTTAVAAVQQQQAAAGASSGSSSKKRFRTKFTAEQKEMMASFAERVGWRMQKQDDAAVDQFCREAGVSRQVFKVWMHNNKNVLVKSKHVQQAPPPNRDDQQLPHHRQSSSSS